MNNLSTYITEKLKINKDSNIAFTIEELHDFLDDYLRKFKDIDFSSYEYEIYYVTSWHALSVNLKTLPNITRAIWQKWQKDIVKVTYKGKKLFTGEISVRDNDPMIILYLYKDVNIK